MSPRTAPDSAAQRVVVARQPITDRSGAVIGFELLYRARRADSPALSAEHMTAEVVLGAMSIGVDQLVGTGQIFCNAERGVLLGQTPLTLPPERTVVEVLETVRIDDDIVAGCRALVEEGFTLALDDFVWTPGAERLLELASIVKIDLLAVPDADLPALIDKCRAFDVVMLAEKVETEAHLERARELGFELFQGYAIERPAVVHGRTVAPSAGTHLQLAMTLLEEDLDFHDLEEVLRREPGLVVSVLQMASAGRRFGLRGQVRTLREALVLLGTVRIRQWVALTVLGGQSSQAPDALATALVRARMTEQLAAARMPALREFAFTAGLLSCLDLLLGATVEELSESLDVGSDLSRAAFDRSGPVGGLIAEVAAYQEALSGRADQDALDAELDEVAAEAFGWAIPMATDLRSA